MGRSVTKFGFSRGQQINRQQPRGQRHLGRGQQRAADQRGLGLAGAALIQDLAVAAEARPAPISTGGTAETLRLTPAIERSAALGFGAVLLKEFCQRQARLKLDPIHRHGTAPRV